MTIHNVDLRTITCFYPLGITVIPHTPTKGKGSRIQALCKCGNKISSCGQKQFLQGRFHLFYAIDGQGSCQKCWMTIYDDQGDDEE